ncbi:MAG: CPBP family intramembrane metalloprotease [Eubacterium sp.]|nr:CPBP family intramembrane metalloprotease [Eubacterium sp.]
MKKLKSIGFAVIYLLIPILLQFIVGIELQIQIILMQWRGKEIPIDALEQMLSNYGFNLILISMINLILIAGMGSWYYFIRKRRDVSPVDYRKILSPKTVGCLAALAFFAQFVCSIVMAVMAFVFPDVFKEYQKLMEGVDINVLPAWATLFIVAVWAPLAEEIVFRAMIFRTLRRGFVFWPAAVLSGIAFGVYHMNLIQGVYASLMGILLAYIYEKTNSLLGVYLFHLSFNLMNYGISYIQQQAGLPELLQGFITLLLMAAAGPGLAVCIYLLSRIYRKQEIEN